MRTLYFDCFAGASGNMILGALMAAGADASELSNELKKLGLPDFELKVERVDRSGIASLHLTVQIPDEKKHRHLPEIEDIILRSTLSDRVKQTSSAIFRRLAAAEAAVHGIDVEKVHFHEVGAFDAIVDIVGSCIGFEILRIERFVCSQINVGSGFVRMEHGTYPVPPPAVAELLKGVPIYSPDMGADMQGELLTPTGAAIITALCDSYGPLPHGSVETVAYGAGTRQYEAFPNVLRVMIGEFETGRRSSTEKDGTIYESLICLETNIDDLSPQVLGFVMDRALEIGALDVWFTSIQMKKNRSAVTVSILCSDEGVPAISEMLYRETTTLGIRSVTVDRRSLPREEVRVETRFGPVTVKTASFRGSVVNAMPEYEEVRRIAAESGIPFRQVQAEILDCYERRRETAQANSKGA